MVDNVSKDLDKLFWANLTKSYIKSLATEVKFKKNIQNFLKIYMPEDLFTPLYERRHHRGFEAFFHEN